MKSFFRFLIFSNILVAFCVLALALSTEILLGIQSNYKISQFVFFATLFAYNFQRVVRIKKGKTHIRKDWLNRHKIAIYGLMLLGGLISARLFFEFQPSTQIAIVVSGILSIGEFNVMELKNLSHFVYSSGKSSFISAKLEESKFIN